MRNAKSQYVTKTGRALSPGRVTRASTRVKRPKERPLPVYLACHPKRLTPTKVHPGCLTFNPVGGMMVATLRAMAGNSVGYARGEGLTNGANGPDPVALYVQGFGTFGHRDLLQAMGWAKAARQQGYTVCVYQ